MFSVQQGVKSIISIIRPNKQSPITGTGHSTLSADEPKVAEVLQEIAASAPINSNTVASQSPTPVRLETPSRRERLLVETLTQTLARASPQSTTTTPSPIIIDRMEPREQILNVIEQIEQRGNEIEGIFRIAGDSNMVECMYADIVAGRPISNITQQDPVNLANLIKIYTKRQFPNLFTSAEVITAISNSKDASAYLAGLSPARRDHIRLLSRVAQSVASNSSKNMMTIDNIARIMAPNFFQPADAMQERDLINVTIDATKTVLLQGLL